MAEDIGYSDKDKSLSGKYRLYLFVAGAAYRSAAAVRCARRLQDEFLKGRCDLTIVDIYQQPELARKEQIIAVPTLLKKEPAPVKRFIGNICNAEELFLKL